MYSHEERDHRVSAFAIEQELRSNVQVLRQIALAIKDQTEHAPWVRCERPIIEPLAGQRFAIRHRREGRILRKTWETALPEFDVIAGLLNSLREHDPHIKPRERSHD